MKDNGNPFVLVIDDDLDLRKLIKKKLESEGFSIEEADSGEAGLEKFALFRPDVVLLDVGLPELDGFEVCRRIRELEHGKYLPILMLTASDDLESISLAYQAGATDFSAKTDHYELLVHRLRYMLRTKNIEHELRISEARLANAQRIAKVGHWELDMSKQALKCSEGICKVLQLGEDGLVSLPEFLQYIHQEDRTNFQSAIKQVAEEKGKREFELRMKSAQGVLYTVRVMAEYYLGVDGSERKIIGILQDVTELKRTEQQIEQLAYHDKVTGLPNRIFLKRYLTHLLSLSRRKNTRVALLYLDIDHFQRINTSLGYNAGDELLVGISQRLQECLRGSDCISTPLKTPGVELERNNNVDNISHLGADEFVVVLSEIQEAEDAAIVCRRIKDGFSRPFTIRGNEICISLSIGITVYPDDGQNEETLMKHIAVALNDAKDSGRDGYKFYTKSMNARSLERLSLETSLRKAVEQNQFSLYYQPKLSLSDHRLLGAEALIRWQHPDFGLVSPADFIPIAETTNLIIPIGTWVLSEACRQLAEWDKQGLSLQNLSVNLSANHLIKPDLHDELQSALVENGITPTRLDIEITESVLMDNIDAVVPILEKLKSLGIDISIDDFGTGYSSLNYLKRLPVSTIKIDRSFVKDLPDNEDDIVIVDAIIALSHSMKLKIVAEGVENAEQCAFLAARDCDQVQGFYFSPPIPADAFIRWAMEYGTAKSVA